jgi:hypothetical protein
VLQRFGAYVKPVSEQCSARYTFSSTNSRKMCNARMKPALDTAQFIHVHGDLSSVGMDTRGEKNSQKCVFAEGGAAGLGGYG